MLLSLFVSEVTTKMMASQQKRGKAMDERMELSVSRTILPQMLHEKRFSFCLTASKVPLESMLAFL